MRTVRSQANESGINATADAGKRQASAGKASSMLMAASFLIGTGLLVALGLRFPQEANRWVQNQDQIRELQDENANLRKLRDERLERLKSFRENYQEQELEIRRQYHLYKPGDTVFMLPPSSGSGNTPAAPSDSAGATQ